MDVSSVVDSIMDVLGAIFLVGTAVLMLAVVHHAFLWIKRAIGF
ncbi:MAG: hypothetical protein KGM99_14640 [Burkholderiales bacterium]|nr:hypothetical protein [Burkholderiales bacterium]